VSTSKQVVNRCYPGSLCCLLPQKTRYAKT